MKIVDCDYFVVGSGMAGLMSALHLAAYNKRGSAEQVFDRQNNDFGWAQLPKSFMAENTVFLLLTALIYNFYKTIISKLDNKAFGLKETSRIKAFV